MAEKDGLQDLGADLGLLQHRFLLGLSSGLPDTMPVPRIALERLRLSNDAINVIIRYPYYAFRLQYQRHLI